MPVWVSALFALVLASRTSGFKSPSSFFDLTAETYSGQTVPFKQFTGQVVLVVNVASQCGYTDSGYTALTHLHNTYHGDGLTILAFPCNQFGNQEPGQGKEIIDFAHQQFQAHFHILKKVEVNGPRSHPVFRYLKQHFPGEVTWNFHGIWLVDRSGKPVKRFNSPDWNEIELEIRELLFVSA